MRRAPRSVMLPLAAALALAGCAFRPEGGAIADDGDDDGGPIVDAREADDAPVAVDARTVDAAVDAARPFDLASCPESYRAINNTTSRYRVIDGGPWSAAAAMCRADLAGATHLAVFSDTGERDAVGAALFFGGEFRRTWLGVWNDGSGARTVTGEPVYPDTSLGSMQAVTWIRDLFTPFRADALTSSFAAVCECDGRASL